MLVANCMVSQDTVVASTPALGSESPSFKPWPRDQYSGLKFSTAFLTYSRQILGEQLETGNNYILYFIKSIIK
jgi:hypothetical protein